MQLEKSDIDDYRKRFPDETKNMSDELIDSIVMATDDDMDDDEWRELFKSEQIKTAAHAHD